MARADLILRLAAAAVADDRELARQTISVLAADERAKRHTALAAQLDAIADTAPSLFSDRMAPTQRGGSGAPAGYAGAGARTLDSVALSTGTRHEVDIFLAEQRHRDALRAAGVAPRHRLLLTGPPGTGKTSLASAVSTELKLPMVTVEYQSLIGSFLGKTGADLGALFQEASQRPSVLFVDEFETLAKERADQQDMGEMKRVVSTLMLLIDSLPSHVILIAATNHPAMLDVAVWRRFQLHLELPLPTRSERAAWARRRAGELKIGKVDNLVRFIREADERPFSWVEEQVLAAKRAEVLRSLTALEG
jgi:MoxR-like ATPase